MTTPNNETNHEEVSGRMKRLVRLIYCLRRPTEMRKYTKEERCGLAADLEEAISRVIDAEEILDKLACGYWRHALNEADDVMNMGDVILDYWRKHDGDIPKPRNL